MPCTQKLMAEGLQWYDSRTMANEGRLSEIFMGSQMKKESFIMLTANNGP